MASLRYLVWFLLSAVAFGVALFAFVLSRNIPALDYGWVNGLVLFVVWIGFIAGLRRSLFEDWYARGGGSLAPRGMAATTLDYHRR